MKYTLNEFLHKLWPQSKRRMGGNCTRREDHPGWHPVACLFTWDTRLKAVYAFLKDALKDAANEDPDSGLCLNDPGLDLAPFNPTRREKYRMALVGERERLKYLYESAMVVVGLGLKSD
eukprot:3939290-Rhodomonas_salina.3